jgi:hypothetical protein
MKPILRTLYVISMIFVVDVITYGVLNLVISRGKTRGM